MSSASSPIPPHRFAEAIKELPLANLHFKAAEIQNSISHLGSSNQQLESFAEEGDRDCAEAIQENQVVIRRMEERVRLLKGEVERRGFKWGDDEQKKDHVESNGNGHDHIESVAESAEVRIGSSRGSLGDEELVRRVMERLNENGDMDEDGDGDGDQGGGGLHL